MMNGISTYLKRRQQIIMRLGKDISDKKSIQDFNQHYFTNHNDLFDAAAVQEPVSKTPLIVRNKSLERIESALTKKGQSL